ncbi:G-protein coupled receptor 52-like [Ruditapes philippinarum]|uniref:G-protein coupled receptor 52-like n=1 Tax=Ruditapes philippinarum TaxID=129788 RepID=UPI00295AC59A|nr:G-protein coupled receptor 52-like [Ruditapes philippinarum]
MKDLYPNCLSLSIYVFGYIIPVLAIFVAAVNILVIIVFQKPNIRSHTTIILTLIAGADMLGIMCSASIKAYHFLFGHYIDLLSCTMAKLTYIFGEICLDMFSMFSLWLTVLLSFIRCKCIKSPFSTRYIHTNRRILAYVLCLWIAVCIVHLPSYFIFDFQIISFVDYKTNITRVTCGILEIDGAFFKSCSRRKAHVIVEMVLDSFLPCILLLYYTTVMLLALRAANKSRSSLRRNNSSIEMIVIDMDCERQTDKIETKEAKASVTARQDQLDDNHY